MRYRNILYIITYIFRLMRIHLIIFFSGILEIFFVVLFGIEVLMRIIAQGYRQYFFSKMNVFDLLVNIGFTHFDYKLNSEYQIWSAAILMVLIFKNNILLIDVAMIAKQPMLYGIIFWTGISNQLHDFYIVNIIFFQFLPRFHLCILQPVYILSW